MDIKPNKKAMHLVMESYANIGDTESTRNVMKRSRAMGFTPTSDTMNIILKSILKSADTNAWEEILKCYSEHFGYLKFIADSDTYIVLMRACEKYKQPDNAINWFNELLSFGSPITIEIRDTFRRTLGTERYQSYLRGLHSQFRAALHEVDTVIVPISLSIRAHRVSSLSPADSSAPFKDDSEDIGETSDETFFNPAAGIAKATRVSPLSSPDAIQQPMKCVVESSLISSYPMRSLEAVRSMMIEASAGSSSSANTTAAESSSSAESSWSKICKLRTLSDTFAKKGDALGAERILKVAADWHVEPGMMMYTRLPYFFIE